MKQEPHVARDLLGHKLQRVPESMHTHKQQARRNTSCHENKPHNVPSNAACQSRSGINCFLTAHAHTQRAIKQTKQLAKASLKSIPP